MTFAYGTTRFVFCVGPLAIKFPRLKILHFAKRCIHFRKHGGVIRKITQLTETQRASVVRDLFAGVVANWHEVRLYRRYPYLPLAPTYFSFLGLVNIQARGVPLEPCDLKLCPLREISNSQTDFDDIRNFARVNGTPCLIDYGNGRINAILAEFAKTRQVVYEH